MKEEIYTLVCNRINGFANRCINCGAKAGHKCEINNNSNTFKNDDT